MSKNREIAEKTAKLLDEHKTEDTVLMDIGDVSSFADYIIIATVRSGGHQRGLLNILNTFLKEEGIEPFRGKKRTDEVGWVLIDCGFLVVNLMDKETRDFYELEKVWFEGKKIPMTEKE
jgi:ribosome-associated protein